MAIRNFRIKELGSTGICLDRLPTGIFYFRRTINLNPSASEMILLTCKIVSSIIQELRELRKFRELMELMELREPMQLREYNPQLLYVLSSNASFHRTKLKQKRPITIAQMIISQFVFENSLKQ